MKNVSLICLFGFFLSACATVPSDSIGPPLGSLFEDSQISIQLNRVNQLYNANRTCELGVTFVNKSAVELEPNFRMLLLNKVSDTVGQEKLDFPVVMPGKSFNGIKYVYMVGCSNIASIRLSRIK